MYALLDFGLGNQMPYWKALVWFLTITSVFMSASYTMLVPFLPMYLIDELGVAQSDVNIWSGLIFHFVFDQCHHGSDLGSALR